MSDSDATNSLHVQPIIFIKKTHAVSTCLAELRLPKLQLSADG